MKKFFTLIAMAMMAAGASAQTEWRPTEEAPAAGSSIIKDDLLKVETVFETTCGITKDETDQPTTVTFAGKSFNTYMQIRVDAAPTAAVPTGTDKGGSTPLVITPKKNVDLTVYYRRQSASDAYTENDGKDMKLIDQAKPTSAITAATYEAYDIDGAYANAVKVFKLDAGKVYTLWARGTTGRLYGLDYVEGTGGGGGGATADGTYYISFDGMSAANKIDYDNGFSLQITGNESKDISGGKKITVDGNQYTSMKVSNGAQNTLTLPEGKIASGISFYSYVNKDAATDRDSYWKEVAGVSYDAETSGGIFANYGEPEGTPDERSYSFGADKLHTITFTNTGEQCCYVIKIDIATGSEVITGIETVKSESIDLNAPIYNLAGQQVYEGYKGVVIQNGRKYVK